MGQLRQPPQARTLTNHFDFVVSIHLRVRLPGIPL
jgi:hypothetical protein